MQNMPIGAGSSVQVSHATMDMVKPGLLDFSGNTYAIALRGEENKGNYGLVASDTRIIAKSSEDVKNITNDVENILPILKRNGVTPLFVRLDISRSKNCSKVELRIKCLFACDRISQLVKRGVIHQESHPKLMRDVSVEQGKSFYNVFKESGIKADAGKLGNIEKFKFVPYDGVNKGINDGSEEVKKVTYMKERQLKDILVDRRLEHTIPVTEYLSNRLSTATIEEIKRNK